MSYRLTGECVHRSPFFRCIRGRAWFRICTQTGASIVDSARWTMSVTRSCQGKDSKGEQCKVRSTPRLTKNAFGYFFSGEAGELRTVLHVNYFSGLVFYLSRVAFGWVASGDLYNLTDRGGSDVDSSNVLRDMSEVGTEEDGAFVHRFPFWWVSPSFFFICE